MRTCIVVQCREPNKCSNFKEDDSALPLYELLLYSATAIYSYILYSVQCTMYMVCAGGGGGAMGVKMDIDAKLLGSPAYTGRGEADRWLFVADARLGHKT